VKPDERSCRETAVEVRMIYVAPLAMETTLLHNPGLRPGQVYLAPLGLKGHFETCFIHPTQVDNWIYCQAVAVLLSNNPYTDTQLIKLSNSRIILYIGNLIGDSLKGL